MFDNGFAFEVVCWFRRLTASAKPPLIVCWFIDVLLVALMLISGLLGEMPPSSWSYILVEWPYLATYCCWPCGEGSEDASMAPTRPKYFWLFYGFYLLCDFCRAGGATLESFPEDFGATLVDWLKLMLAWFFWYIVMEGR